MKVVLIIAIGRTALRFRGASKLFAWPMSTEGAAAPLRGGQPIRVGEAAISLGCMRDSTHLLEDAEALRREYAEQGYLMFRGLLPRDAVLAARAACIARLRELGRVCSLDGEADAATISGGWGGEALFYPELQASPPVKGALENTALRELFARLFGEAPSTFSYKWLRAVGREEFTGAHLDRVYMGRGSQSLLTAWIPLGHTPLEMGTIVVLPRSHADARCAVLRAGYGQLDVDRDCPNDPLASGHVTNNPATWAPKAPRVAWDAAALAASVPPEARAAGWVSADFEPGDVVVFGMDTLHMSTVNTTARFRISCDTRWQPASHPVDERWAGGPSDGKPHRHFCGDRPRKP